VVPRPGEVAESGWRRRLARWPIALVSCRLVLGLEPEDSLCLLMSSGPEIKGIMEDGDIINKYSKYRAGKVF
jgi:hypothetical protein